MPAPVRARDLRANIKDYGFEQGVVVTIESFLDEYAETRQHLRDVVDLLDRVINEVQKLTTVGDGMAKAINQMRRDAQNEEPRE
jgi:hypothetical protein